MQYHPNFSPQSHQIKQSNNQEQKTVRRYADFLKLALRIGKVSVSEP
jgi:hypothetical protein